MTDAFDAFVDQQVEEDARHANRDWNRRREGWLAELDKFYGDIREYLRKHIEARKISIKQTPVDLDEDYIGEYKADALEIKIGGATVYLEPVGTLLLAVKGRVDMWGPNGKTTFVLVPKNCTRTDLAVSVLENILDDDNDTEEGERAFDNCEWKISPVYPDRKLSQLTDASFQNAIMEVVDG